MRSAKTELEKIDFKTFTCRQAVNEITRMYVLLVAVRLVACFEDFNGSVHLQHREVPR